MFDPGRRWGTALNIDWACKLARPHPRLSRHGDGTEISSRRDGLDGIKISSSQLNASRSAPARSDEHEHLGFEMPQEPI